jgi:hypothetical protein
VVLLVVLVFETCFERRDDEDVMSGREEESILKPKHKHDH